MPKIKDFFSSLDLKLSFFLLLYSLFLIGSIVFSLPFFKSIFLCLLVISFWKIFSGFSWFNFFSLFLGFLEANILILWVKPLWVIAFILVFLYLFGKKLFFSLSKEKNQQEILFYYLYLFWVIISFGLYFFLNYPFWFGFLAYALGLIVFTYYYVCFSFLSADISYPDFLSSFFALILINLEFFLLLSYFSLNTIVLSILTLLVFRLVIYYHAYFHKNKSFPILFL